jgi:hypothetical protein
MLREKEGSAVHLRSVWVEDNGAFYEQVLSLLALLVQKYALFLSLSLSSSLSLSLSLSLSTN